ncbi:SIS domain-containing protein [Nitrososphaera sp.]|uniref:SIS domain-containing protein n=1 Tax=Nitrososphaera sp. TaxID=1971748 RepID=UPI001843DA92|nr:SIS domain-containing protein [Nitrososphaera sp.]NWG36859.1 SIS domain-containing protein [Nitrososphaera sp.]
MNSIEAMALDIWRQLVDLPAMPLPEPARGRAIFAGSGDSYAAALAGSHLSPGRVLCFYPADIIANPAIVKGASAYFLSISGKTRANVQAAEAARSAGASTVAVTAEPSSPLAKACDNTFVLQFKNAGKTSGTIGFTASLLACAQIASGAACPADLKAIYGAASKKATRIASSIQTKSAVLLGDSLLYPAAVYGALKLNEVFGSRAAAYPLEDFCHAPLFGHKDEQTVVLGSGDDARVSRRLGRAGLKVLYVDCGKYDGLCSILYATFFMQHLVLAVARRKRMKECYFLQNEKLLAASSDIIY